MWILLLIVVAQLNINKTDSSETTDFIKLIFLLCHYDMTKQSKSENIPSTFTEILEILNFSTNTLEITLALLRFIQKSTSFTTSWLWWVLMSANHSLFIFPASLSFPFHPSGFCYLFACVFFPVLIFFSFCAALLIFLIRLQIYIF